MHQDIDSSGPQSSTGSRRRIEPALNQPTPDVQSVKTNDTMVSSRVEDDAALVVIWVCAWINAPQNMVSRVVTTSGPCSGPECGGDTTVNLRTDAGLTYRHWIVGAEKNSCTRRARRFGRHEGFTYRRGELVGNPPVLG